MLIFPVWVKKVENLATHIVLNELLQVWTKIMFGFIGQLLMKQFKYNGTRCIVLCIYKTQILALINLLLAFLANFFEIIDIYEMFYGHF